MERHCVASGLRSMMLLAPVAHATGSFCVGLWLMTQHQTKMLNYDKRPCFMPIEFTARPARGRHKNCRAVSPGIATNSILKPGGDTIEPRLSRPLG